MVSPDRRSLREQRLAWALAEAATDLAGARKLETQQLELALLGHRHDHRAAVEYVAALQDRVRALRDLAWKHTGNAFLDELAPLPED